MYDSKVVDKQAMVLPLSTREGTARYRHVSFYVRCKPNARSHSPNVTEHTDRRKLGDENTPDRKNATAKKNVNIFSNPLFVPVPSRTTHSLRTSTVKQLCYNTNTSAWTTLAQTSLADANDAQRANAAGVGYEREQVAPRRWTCLFCKMLGRRKTKGTSCC